MQLRDCLLDRQDDPELPGIMKHHIKTRVKVVGQNLFDFQIIIENNVKFLHV